MTIITNSMIQYVSGNGKYTTTPPHPIPPPSGKITNLERSSFTGTFVDCNENNDLYSYVKVRGRLSL